MEDENGSDSRTSGALRTMVVIRGRRRWQHGFEFVHEQQRAHARRPVVGVPRVGRPVRAWPASRITTARASRSATMASWAYERQTRPLGDLASRPARGYCNQGSGCEEIPALPCPWELARETCRGRDPSLPLGTSASWLSWSYRHDENIHGGMGSKKGIKM
jgi:hypothetical protein